jgi:hypothetical protein
VYVSLSRLTCLRHWNAIGPRMTIRCRNRFRSMSLRVVIPRLGESSYGVKSGSLLCASFVKIGLRAQTVLGAD